VSKVVVGDSGDGEGTAVINDRRKGRLWVGDKCS